MRLVELALVVPVEVGSRLVEAVPIVVDKVPSAAARVRREIVLARFLGKLAVDQGIRELRSRLASDPAAVATAPAAGPPDDPASPAESRDVDTAAHSDTLDAETLDPDTLALADYDHLSSAQIVAKLEGLDAVERHSIEMYEQAGRHRRTILGKLDQLRVAEPAS